MKETTYFNDISAYIRRGNKQNISYHQLPEQAEDLKTKVSTRFSQFGRVTIVAGLAIVSAPVAIASSIVAAPFASLFCFVHTVKTDIEKYIKTPEQQRNLTALLKDIGTDVLRSIAAFFLAIAVLSVDITLLATTFITHTRHMQTCKMVYDGY